jgi:hypothetical protein
LIALIINARPRNQVSDVRHQNFMSRSLIS